MHIKSCLRRELALFRDHPRLRVGAFVLLALIPALYAFTFLRSIWNPFAEMGNLPVALVNLDEGHAWTEGQLELGRDVLAQVRSRANFAYHDFPGEAEALRALARGEVYFAIVLPRNFSRSALQGTSKDPAQVLLYIDESLGFTAAMIGRRMGSELTAAINQRLNEKRWHLVMTESAHAESGLQSLRAGIQRLKAGAEQLVLGETHLSQNLSVLQRGLGELYHGAGMLHDGSKRLRESTANIPFIGGRIAGGAGQLESGAERIESGLSRARDGGARLEEGAGLLQVGALELKSGLDLIAVRLPKEVHKPEGDPSGLAGTVQLNKKDAIRDLKYGESFAPYFLALSLWLGGVLCTFFFYLRRLPESMRGESKATKLVTKMFLPLTLVCFQAIALIFVCRFALRMELHSPFLFTATVLQGGVLFFLIIFSLILLFRDAGRLVALLFFVFQLASAGAAFPVEMSGAIYRAANPYLPFGNVVRALRASALGAFEGASSGFMVRAWVAAGLLFCAAILASRWKYVSDDSYSFMPDID